METGRAGQLRKLYAADLDRVLAVSQLKPRAMALIADCRTVPGALASLEDGGMPRQAVRLLAHALPQREAVWWACMCARHTAPANLAETDRLALEGAEAWVRQPSDEAKQAAAMRAEAAAAKSPEVWAAIAVAWSGAATAPPDPRRQSPSRKLPGTAVVGSIILASLRRTRAASQARLQRFLQSGRGIASGGGGRLAVETP